MLDIYRVILELQITAFKTYKLFTWFNNNHMKANTEKSQLLLNCKLRKNFFGGVLVESSSTKKFLGIQIDSDLTFDEDISSICNKVGKIN